MTSQDVVLDWFVSRRLCGNHDFFTVSFISKCLNGESYGLNGDVRRSVNRLFVFGFLEVEDPDCWIKKFRVREEFVYG